MVGNGTIGTIGGYMPTKTVTIEDLGVCRDAFLMRPDKKTWAVLELNEEQTNTLSGMVERMNATPSQIFGAWLTWHQENQAAGQLPTN